MGKKRKEFCEHCDKITVHVFYTRKCINTYELARCKECKATTRLEVDTSKEDFNANTKPMGF